MNIVRKRLMCLNIAIIVAGLFLCTGYVSAVTAINDTDNKIVTQINEVIKFDDNELLRMRVDKPRNNTEKYFEILQSAFYSSPDSSSGMIYVDGYGFMSYMDRSGNGWSYSASKNTLYLNDYSGGGISANGDLTIFSSGDVNIVGADAMSGNGYAEAGISAGGNLYIVVADGTLTSVGGKGIGQGGEGIFAEHEIEVKCRNGASARFVGGECTARGNNWCGDGIWAKEYVYLSGDGSVTAIGGSTEKADKGGFGIRTEIAEIYIDTVIFGGDGAFYGGCGIYFVDSCEFGIVNGYILGGTGYINGSATESPSGTLYYNKHTTLSKNGISLEIAVNEYKLELFGNGGKTEAGYASIVLQNPYPQKYWMNAGVFYRDGYTQVAWSEKVNPSSKNLMRINTEYCPVTNSSLYAYWIKTNNGDIVLNALNGQFSDKTFYKRYTTASIKLPERLTYGDKDERLLAWCDSTIPSTLGGDADNLYICEGKWYENGETIKRDPSAVTELYGYNAYGGDYAIYHPTRGSVKQGGSIMVQESSIVSAGSLEIIFPGEEFLNVPDGYELEGWASSPNAAKAEYAPNEHLKKWGYYEIPHFYAVWKIKAYSISPENGVTVSLIPLTKKVCITMSDSWCSRNGVKNGICAFYQSDGKFLQPSSMRPAINGCITIELSYSGNIPPVCKIFALDELYRPAVREINAELDEFM